MPLSDRLDLPHGTVVLWKIDETEAELRMLCTPGECAYAAERFSSESRRREWLAWHAALRQIVPEAEPFYLPDGAPAIGNALRIGVSHTEGYAAVFVAKSACAVDIERKERDFLRAARRYLSPEEEALCAETAGALSPGLVWCAKETLYKLAGGKRTDLLRDIRIAGFDLCGPSIHSTVAGKPFRLGTIPHEELHIVFGAAERE